MAGNTCKGANNETGTDANNEAGTGLAHVALAAEPFQSRSLTSRRRLTKGHVQQNGN